MIDVFDHQYAFLSNFYPSPFTFQGIEYPTNEHFFQAMKTLNVEDRKRIAAASTPGQAKRLGRHVDLTPEWEEIKDKIMFLGLELKFTSSPGFKEALLSTGTEYLEEGNFHHDNIWGNCKCSNCIKIKGENRLGKALMKLRAEMREEEV